MDLELEVYIDKILKLDYEPRSLFIKIMQKAELNPTEIALAMDKEIHFYEKKINQVNNEKIDSADIGDLISVISFINASSESRKLLEREIEDKIKI